MSIAFCPKHGHIDTDFDDLHFDEEENCIAGHVHCLVIDCPNLTPPDKELCLSCFERVRADYGITDQEETEE